VQRLDPGAARRAGAGVACCVVISGISAALGFLWHFSSRDRAGAALRPAEVGINSAPLAPSPIENLLPRREPAPVPPVAS
jgi:hypothetical protein